MSPAPRVAGRFESVAIHPILIVGQEAESKPIAGHVPPFGLQLRARHLLREFERLAGFRSALLATHHGAIMRGVAKKVAWRFNEKLNS